MPVGASALECHVLPEGIAVLGEPAEERRAHGARVRHGRPTAEHAEARDFGQGLGEDGVRPGERGSTQQREACASCDTYGHGITSSVQEKSNSRSVSPRAMAVWP